MAYNTLSEIKEAIKKTKIETEEINERIKQARHEQNVKVLKAKLKELSEKTKDGERMDTNERILELQELINNLYELNDEEKADNMESNMSIISMEDNKDFEEMNDETLKYYLSHEEYKTLMDYREAKRLAHIEKCRKASQDLEKSRKSRRIKKRKKTEDQCLEYINNRETNKALILEEKFSLFGKSKDVSYTKDYEYYHEILTKHKGELGRTDDGLGLNDTFFDKDSNAAYELYYKVYTNSLNSFLLGDSSDLMVMMREPLIIYQNDIIKKAIDEQLAEDKEKEFIKKQNLKQLNQMIINDFNMFKDFLEKVGRDHK